jgi:hypothetical protein
MEAASADGSTRHGVAHSFSPHAACGNWRPHVFALHGPEHNGSLRRSATLRMACEGRPSPSSKLIPVGRISQVGRGCGVSRWVCDTDMASMRRQRCKLGTKRQTVLQTEGTCGPHNNSIGNTNKTFAARQKRAFAARQQSSVRML